MSLTKSRGLVLNRGWTHNEKLHFPLPIAKFLHTRNVDPSGAPLLCAAASAAIDVIRKERLPNVIKIKRPLSMTNDIATRILDVLEEAISEVEKER